MAPRTPLIDAAAAGLIADPAKDPARSGPAPSPSGDRRLAAQHERPGVPPAVAVRPAAAAPPALPARQPGPVPPPAPRSGRSGSTGPACPAAPTTPSPGQRRPGQRRAWGTDGPTRP